MKRTILTSTAIAFLLIGMDCAGKRTIRLTGDLRAISLNSLQSRLKTCQPSNSCPRAVLEMAGIKHVIGVTADEKNRDLIIFGQADNTSPPLHLEDFVVAIKSAWRKYARLEGDIYYY